VSAPIKQESQSVESTIEEKPIKPNRSQSLNGVSDTGTELSAWTYGRRSSVESESTVFTDMGECFTHRLEMIPGFQEFEGKGKNDHEQFACIVQRIESNYDSRINERKWPESLKDKRMRDRFPFSRRMVIDETKVFDSMRKVLERYPGYKLHDYAGKGRMGWRNVKDWPRDALDMMIKLFPEWWTVVRWIESYERHWLSALKPGEKPADLNRFAAQKEWKEKNEIYEYWKNRMEEDQESGRKAIKAFLSRCTYSERRKKSVFMVADTQKEADWQIGRVHLAERALQSAVGCMGLMDDMQREALKNEPMPRDCFDNAGRSLLGYIRNHPRGRKLMRAIEIYPALVEKIKPNGPEGEENGFYVADHTSFPILSSPKTGRFEALISSSHTSSTETETQVGPADPNAMETGSVQASIEESSVQVPMMEETVTETPKKVPATEQAAAPQEQGTDVEMESGGADQNNEGESDPTKNDGGADPNKEGEKGDGEGTQETGSGGDKEKKDGEDGGKEPDKPKENPIEVAQNAQMRSVIEALEFLRQETGQLMDFGGEDRPITYFYAAREAQREYDSADGDWETAQMWRDMIPAADRQNAMTMYRRWAAFELFNEEAARVIFNDYPDLRLESPGTKSYKPQPKTSSRTSSVKESEKRVEQSPDVIPLAALSGEWRQGQTTQGPRTWVNTDPDIARRVQRSGSRFGGSMGVQRGRSGSQQGRRYFEQEPRGQPQAEPRATLGSQFSSSTASTRSFRADRTWLNKMPKQSCMRGDRMVLDDMDRDYDAAGTMMEPPITYQIIWGCINFGLGVFIPSLNPVVARTNKEIPMLMQFGRKDMQIEKRFTPGEKINVNYYAMLKEKGKVLPFQSRFDPLHSMVRDGVLRSNQIAIKFTEQPQIRNKVSRSLCIVDRAWGYGKQGQLQRWELDIDSNEDWRTIHVPNAMVSYALRELPRRGEILCLDGFRCNNQYPYYSKWGCFFMVKDMVEGAELVEDGCYPVRVGPNEFADTVDELMFGWKEANPQRFRVKHRMGCELAGALMVFEKNRTIEMTQDARVPIEIVTPTEEDYVYHVKINTAGIRESRDKLKAVANIDSMVLIYKRAGENGEYEMPIMRGYVDDTEYDQEGRVSAFVIRHFMDKEGGARAYSEIPVDVESFNKTGVDLNLAELDIELLEIQARLRTNFCASFCENLNKDKIWIRKLDNFTVLQRVHSLQRTLKQKEWPIQSQYGQIMSIMNGQEIPRTTFDWQTAIAEKTENKEVGYMIAQEKRERVLIESIKKDTVMDDEQKKTLINFLGLHVPVNVLEAFGGSGKTFSIANAIIVYLGLKPYGGHMNVMSKTNDSVKVIAEALGPKSKVESNKVLIVQSILQSMKNFPSKAYRFTVEAKAEALLLTDDLSANERLLLEKFTEIRKGGVQMAKDMSAVRKIVIEKTDPSVFLTTTDMGINLGHITREMTHAIFDEGSLAEDAKIRGMFAMCPKLVGVLVAGDPGQLEPFTHIRDSLKLKQYGLGPLISQMIIRDLASVVSLIWNRRSIPSLLPPIMETSVRYKNMKAAKAEPKWDEEVKLCFPPVTRYKSPYVLIDCDGLHELTPTGSLSNTEQEEIVRFYLDMIQDFVDMGAIPRGKVLVLNFYQGTNQKVKKIIAGKPYRNRVTSTTVDSAQGMQTPILVTTTTRAEQGQFTTGVDDEGSGSFIHSDHRVRVDVGRPELIHVFIGRMDFLTLHKGALQNFLRKACEQTPVLDGAEFMRMNQKWMDKVKELRETDPTVPVEGPARYPVSEVLYRDMIHGADPTNLSHLSKCRLNVENGWLDLSRHLDTQDLPEGYKYEQPMVSYTAQLPELTEARERLRARLEGDAYLKKPIEGTTTSKVQDNDDPTAMDTTEPINETLAEKMEFDFMTGEEKDEEEKDDDDGDEEENGAK
jgi:hypothetical protein